MCAVLLPPGVNPTAVNKYIISILYGAQLFMKLPFCHLEHLDSLKLGHAKWLKS